VVGGGGGGGGSAFYFSLSTNKQITLSKLQLHNSIAMFTFKALTLVGFLPGSSVPAADVTSTAPSRTANYSVFTILIAAGSCLSI
jgi:hypothetical protein